MISCTTEVEGEEYFPTTSDFNGEEETSLAGGEEEPPITIIPEGAEGPPPPVLESDGASANPFGAF
jgi:hypothetical protein